MNRSFNTRWFWTKEFNRTLLWLAPPELKFYGEYNSSLQVEYCSSRAFLATVVYSKVWVTEPIFWQGRFQCIKSVSQFSGVCELKNSKWHLIRCAILTRQSTALDITYGRGHSDKMRAQLQSKKTKAKLYEPIYQQKNYTHSTWLLNELL